MPFCLQEAVKIDIPDLQQRFKRITLTGLLAGGAFAPYERFRRRQNLGVGAALPPRAFQAPKGGAALWAAQPKKKDTTFVVPFFLVDLIGFEPTTPTMRM